MCALPAVGHEHHAALLPHVNTLVELAEELDAPHPPGFDVRLAAEHRFIIGQLVPHMERAEATLYPELERLMQNRHSMTPMRREHDELRGLIRELGEFVGRDLTLGVRMRLRRVLYRTFALLKTHLAEEEAYLGMLDRNLSQHEQEELGRAMEHATWGPSEVPPAAAASAARR
jgi:hypothetical protein